MAFKGLPALMVLLLAVSQVYGGERIGVFSMSRVVNESIAGKEMRAKLRELRKEQQKALEGIAKELQKLQARIKGLDPSDPAFEGVRDELRRKRQEYREMRRRWREELSTRFMDFSNRIAEEVRKIVKGLAEEKGFDYVFEERSSGVVVFPSSSDITSEVIEIYDRQYRERRK